MAKGRGQQKRETVYMRHFDKDYYCIDVDIETKKIVDWCVVPQAKMEEYSDEPKIYRIWLTKGQFNKFVKALSLDLE